MIPGTSCYFHVSSWIHTLHRYQIFVTVVCIHCKFVHLFCTRNIYFSSIRPWRDPCSVALPEVSSTLTPWPETLCIESCVIVCLVLERDIRTFFRIRHECPRRLKDKLVRFWRPKVKDQGQTRYFNSSGIHMMTE